MDVRMSDTTQHERQSRLQRVLPAIALMLLAPLIAEVLPGATRFSVIHFVLPIQILVWGGGAVMIREAVRRLRLGWLNMLFLAVALSMAEECLIQQTSLAPLVIKIRGEEYARAFNVNYVYFLWAVIYESLFVVFIPIGLAELIFRRKRVIGWLSRAGVAIVSLLFVPGCLLAWFSWTHIARIIVFHMEAYAPPIGQTAIAAAGIGVLIGLAVGPLRHWLSLNVKALRPPHPLVLFLLSGGVVVVVFGLELLAFGISPPFPPLAAVAIGFALVALMIAFVPRFFADATWNSSHQVGILYGAIITNMAIFFLGLRDAPPLDFYGKVVLDAVAVVLLLWLAMWLRAAPEDAGQIAP
jgi:hypothetical protein